MIRLWVVWAVFLSGVVPAFGQSVDATLSKSRVYVGDELVYSVVLRDGAAGALPEVDFPASVNAGFSSQSQQSRVSTEIVNGRRQQVRIDQVVYAYRVRATQPGTVRIPGATVTLSDGRTLVTPEVSFEALLPEPSPDFKLEISIPRTTLYVGETVRAPVTWTIPRTIDDWTFDTTPLPDELVIEPSETPPPAPSGRVTEFEWFGKPVYASIEQVFAAGREEIRLRFDLLITPTDTGESTLGPLRVVFDQFTARTSYTRAYAESDPLRLTVLPLPAEGRPAGYEGLIGSYELRTMATPTTANVGDPITLRAELSGTEPMTGADALPDLGSQPLFTTGFRVSGEGWVEEQPRERGLRVFTTTLRALSDDVREIPPITLHTFDPEAGAYRTVVSDRIQLDIRAVREATIADAEIAPGGRQQQSRGLSRPILTPSEPAFWAPPSAEDIRHAAPFNARDALTTPGAIITLALGPATLGASAVLLGIKRRAADPRHRRRRALRRAEHTAIRAGAAAGVRIAVAELLNADPESIAASDIDRLSAHPGVKRTLR